MVRPKFSVAFLLWGEWLTIILLVLKGKSNTEASTDFHLGIIEFSEVLSQGFPALRAFPGPPG